MEMTKRLILVLFVLTSSLFSYPKALGATLYTYTNGGSSGAWASASTWTTDPSGVSLVGSAVPGNGDVVYILNGFTVVLGANVSTTSLTININNGGTLDLSTFTIATISTLSGSGTLKIKAGYFPTITTNTFISGYASGATVEYYDFAGTLPVSINYPNLIFTNTTTTNHTINFANTSAYSFSVAGNLVTRATSTGTLTVNLGTQITNSITLTVSGSFTTGAGTTFGAGNFNAVHNLSLNGSMTNNGTVRFSNAAQYTATDVSNSGVIKTTFTGATDNTLACNGVTNFYTLAVNKGLSSTNILSVTSTSTANLNFYANGQLFNVINGTLKLGANITIPQVYGAGSSNFDVGSSSNNPMLWIDGATLNTNTAAMVVYGKFRITAGSFTSMGGQGTVIREEGQYIIEGGTFTTEKFRPSSTATTHRGSFIISGGTFNASGTIGSDPNYARFSLPYPDQVFIMSGGTINVSNPQSSGGAANGGIHIGCSAANYSVTGGTVNAILSGAASLFTISSVAPFWNLSVSRTGGTPATVQLSGIGSIANTVTAAQPLVVLNDFTIDGINTPSFNANGLNVTVGKNFTISSGGTYTPSANTTTFNGAVDQSFTNNGTITTGLYNMVVDKSTGALLLNGAAASFTVTQMLTLNNGILNDGGKILQVAGAIENNAIHTGTGNITLNGLTTQTLSGNGNGIFGNLILNNTSTPGATLTSDLTVSGTLTLAGTGNSLFDISQYQLSLTSVSSTALTTTGNSFSDTKMIRTLGLQSDGGVKKTFGNLSAFTFAFGVGNNYTPAILQLTSAPSSYGTITARAVSSRHQFITTGNTNNLTWYWKVVGSGFTGLGAAAVNHTYQYVENSVLPSGDDVNYIPARYNPTSWTVISDLALVNETSNVISFTGVGYIDGEFTAGVPSSFGAVKIFYSKRSGSWSDVTPGTTPWSNVSHSGADATTAPVVGDHVYIGDGATFNHVITIISNGQACGGMEISVGSTLDVGVYTGHNFGTFENSQISGSGLLRISSAAATAEFPAGDFGNFIRALGGTVEYYTTGSQDFTIPINSSAPTTLPLITYRSLVLTPGAGRFIRMPDQDERIYNHLIVQGTTSTGIARLNTTSARTLTINGNLVVSSGNLQFQNTTSQNLEIDGNVQVSSGAIFNLAGTGSATVHQLSLKGNLVNNGVLNFVNTSSYVCNTLFEGAANASITGAGATTNFNILTVSKGTSPASVLEVNATAFTLAAVAIPLVLSNGTFRLTSTQTVTIANGADFSIPATSKLSANGGTLQLTGNDGIDLLVSGTLEMLNGGINIGTTANDNSIEYAATGQPTIIISGGTLNVKAQIRRSFASTQGALTYTQSGPGVVSVGLNSAATNARGVFEILNNGSSFNMTDGTLRITRASGGSSIADLYLQPASSSVTGGTIEIGTGTSQVIDINSSIPVYNVAVTGTTNTAKLEFNGLTLRGSLTIASGNIFNASGLDVNIAGNFINSNVSAANGVTTGGYQAGTVNQTTTFNGSTGNQSLTGITSNLTNFGNLVVNNTFSGGVVTLQTTTNLRINGVLILTTGTLAETDNTITAVSTVSNSAIHTSTTGSITLAGSTNQIITGNGSGKFGNLTLNNSSGATFAANQEVTGVLTFTNGSLFIGSFALNLSNTSLAAIAGASSLRYIISSGQLSDSGITKAFAPSVTNGNFIYPIGVSGKYTPANYTLSTGAIGGTITLRPVNSKHPSATGSGTAFINYYWSVTQSVIILNALTHTYTYVATDESGTVADYRDARFKGGAWTIGITPGNPNTTTRVITFTNTDLAGDYTAGEATAFVNPTTYISIASGSWESDLSVWNVDPPGTNLGPPAGSFVIISEGTTVVMTANSKRMATLEVRGRLHLGNTNGHDFGTVTTGGTGDRTLQLQSSTFPTGDFSSFMVAGGGTVEYDGTVILPTQNTYNHVRFTSTGNKTLPNADLTINGNFTVVAGTVTNAVNNRSVVLVNSTGDFTNNGVFTTGSGIVIVGRHLINSGAGASFAGGSGTYGLRVGGDFINSASATFTASTDSVGVRGNFINSATFTAGSGAIRITGNFSNSAGTFTAGAGGVAVIGSLTNNATYTAGTGATTVRGAYLNSGASAIHHANANALTVTGNFTNSSGAVFNAGTGSLFAGANWINSATFNAGTGSVTFNRSSGQALTGVTTFYNLIRVNGGSLTLNNDINADGLLTLTSGNIITGSNTIQLTRISAPPVSGQSPSSFIDGGLSISYPNTAGTSRIFPVGKGSIYRPVTIQQTAASSSPVARTEMINTPPTGSYPVAVGVLSEARYYSVDLISGSMNSPTIELSFNTNGVADESIITPGNVHVMRATSSTGPWTDEGGSGVFSPASPAGYATSGVTSVATPTFFTLGYQNVVLPISLKSFDAALKNDFVEVSWITLSEHNNDFFTIERSADGIKFDSIGVVKGAGNSQSIISYGHTDTDPLSGTSYYRLKQTDYDKTDTYSEVKRIVNDKVKASELLVYPNPVEMGAPLFVKFNSDTSQDKKLAWLAITDITGRTLYYAATDLTSEIDVHSLPLTFRMEQGIYFVRVISRDFMDTKKVIVK